MSDNDNLSQLAKAALLKAANSGDTEVVQRLLEALLEVSSPVLQDPDVLNVLSRPDMSGAFSSAVRSQITRFERLLEAEKDVKRKQLEEMLRRGQ